MRGSIELAPDRTVWLLDALRRRVLNSLKGASRRRARPCAFEPLGVGTSSICSRRGRRWQLADHAGSHRRASRTSNRTAIVSAFATWRWRRRQTRRTSASQRRRILPPAQTLPRPSLPRRRRRRRRHRDVAIRCLERTRRPERARPPSPTRGTRANDTLVVGRGTSSGASTPESQLSTTPMTLVVLTCASIARSTSPPRSSPSRSAPRRWRRPPVRPPSRNRPRARDVVLQRPRRRTARYSMPTARGSGSQSRLNRGVGEVVRVTRRRVAADADETRG